MEEVQIFKDPTNSKSDPLRSLNSSHASIHEHPNHMNVSSPHSLESPPLTSKEARVFQFPPPAQYLPEPPLIKQEDLSTTHGACAEAFDDLAPAGGHQHNMTFLTFPPGGGGGGGNSGQACSPMAISPASLNTPRGSIVSMRSRQQSPMNLDAVMTSSTVTATLAAAPAAPAVTTVTSTTGSCGGGNAVGGADLAAVHDLGDVQATFTIQIPPHQASGKSAILPPYDEAFDTFAPYHHSVAGFENPNERYPSPPCSGYDSPPPSAACSQVSTTTTTMPPSVPSYSQNNYEDFYSHKHHLLAGDPLLGHAVAGEEGGTPSVFASAHNVPTVITKPDPDYMTTVMSAGMQASPATSTTSSAAAAAAMSCRQVTRHLSTDSTCPETPDSSSIKEETFFGEDCSPAGGAGGGDSAADTGSYVCLWAECNEEFYSQKTLVDHVNDSHMDTRKGCEEFPCLWKDCCRNLKAFNAKYKLITHMRVHTKEKPYLCTFEGCNRAFARSENRKIHVRSHTGQKPFSCKYQYEFNCTKKFSNSSDRAKHEQTHKDPKPYKCEVVGCSKRYTDPSSLRKHVKGHSTEEQLQYRRSKDLANLAKRSNSPTSRYANWVPPAGLATPLAPASPPMGPATQQTTTLLKTTAGLQQRSGGTVQLVHNYSDIYPHSSGNNENLSYQERRGLVNQPNSLDDLDDTDGIPFDSVPVRYDAGSGFDSSPYWQHQQQAQANNPNLSETGSNSLN